MSTFTWMNHTFTTEYPESGFRLQFGNSYLYTEGPTAPDQRVFTLSFPLLKYFLNSGGAIDATIQPTLNMKALENFYLEHKMWKTFVYPHPVHGNLNVKFNKPLKVPAGIPDGGGAVGAFSLELIEVP